jgi:hypothetical protein
VSKLAVVEIETRDGVTAAELLDRGADSQRWISASALERWLVESGLPLTTRLDLVHPDDACLYGRPRRARMSRPDARR